jgi:hypothetical protein
METASVNDELYQFIAADYYATGEGRTVMLLITRAYPYGDDYDENHNIKEGHTPKVIAAREFIEEFVGYFARCAENLPREEFVKRYGHHLPEYVHKILAAEGNERPGNFNFKQSLHLNFS